MSGMLESVRRTLVIAPHPDDEVLGCGGTIARMTTGGAEVHVAIVTRAGADRFGPEAADTGVRESRLAHDLLGIAKTHFLKLPAAELDTVPHAEMNAALDAVMKEVRPDTVFVPFIGDVHLDHQLVFLSSMVATRPRGTAGPVRVYAYETLSETNWYAPGITHVFAPNVYVDIEAFLERKLAAFGCYASQVRSFPDERSPEAIRALAMFRGATVSRRAAESFCLLRQIE